jgi:hypothetical protein
VPVLGWKRILMQRVFAFFLDRLIKQLLSTNEVVSHGLREACVDLARARGYLASNDRYDVSSTPCAL